MHQKNNSELTVAVYMITYNHELFIAQAIESILMQQTNFTYKMFIGEDCSTDQTRNICIDYAEKYPEKIELVLHETNVGATANAQSIYQKCFESGAKYIAMLEGDDYWTDPLKLQKQVDFLEENEEYSLVATNTNFLQDGIIIERNNNKIEYSTNDFFYNNPIHTCSILMKKNVVKSYVNKIKGINFIYGDWVLFFEASLHGKILCLKDTMCIYRLHDGGVHSFLSATDKAKSTIAFLYQMCSVYPQFKDEFKFSIFHYKCNNNLIDYTIFDVLTRNITWKQFIYAMKTKYKSLIKRN